MPAGPRRNSRKASAEDELELKRARGEISCAECRRLKLKCDKKIPCGSCVRRGCTSICPNGSLSAGQGTRFILADTEQLHRKISEMSERIRQLEDALAIFQAGISHERHPLLCDELLSIKFGPEVRRTVDDEHHRDLLSTTIDALGTLTIGEHGESTYFGRSAGSETMLSTASMDDEGEAVPCLGPQLADLAITFPLTIIEDGTDAIVERIEAALPPQPRAWALCETYMEHLSWWSRPIKRDELIDDILVPIYNCKKNKTKTSYHRDAEDDEGKCPHLLAVLCFVFALGSLLDLTLQPCNAEAELYYRLGRAALSLRSVFDSPNIETVQAMLLMGEYHSLCTVRYSLESAWRIFSFTAKLAQSVGLHRDSAPWKLSEKEVQRRRNLFWELFIVETMHSMHLGRPPALMYNQIDCKLPEGDATATDEDGTVYSFKHSYTRHIFGNVMEGMLAAKPPSYAKVLEYDRHIRQTPFPNVRLYLRPEEENYSNPSVVLKSFFLSHFRSITMICVHRTFFAQALLDHPENPLSSPYAPSFLAATRCSSILVRSFLHHYNRSPEICSRFWVMWTHAFTAAVILGSTVTRSPNATMASTALTDLNLAVDVFERGAQLSSRAKQALPILRNLKERALRAFNQSRNRDTAPSLDIQLRIGPEDDFQDELAIFGGHTRVVTSKFLSRKTTRIPAKPRDVRESVTSSPSTASGSTPASGAPIQSSSTPPTSSTPSDDGVPLPQNVEEQMSSVHPSLMEYLSLFPADASVSFMDVDPAAPSLSAGSLPQDYSSVFGTQTDPSAAFSQPPSLGQPMAGHPASGVPQHQAGASNVPLSADLLQFLDILPEIQNTAGPSADPFSFGAATPGVSTDTFDAFASAQLGEQWESLMRETGFFDAGTQGSGAGQDPFATFQGDMHPRY